ncbi:MAG TPA: long-chain fatty acid--CoA ligase [Aggregatilineales bacterium]|nr:long-chain fatty acid--CoA ligase [Anaerolineales bacterium]HRE47903.1 long-chain fatty acid--CoA ligase [Aggregatilineales bacterium]
MAVTYADKPWIKGYDKGVPASCMPYPKHTLFQFLTDAAKKNPSALCTLTSAHLPLLGRQAATTTYGEIESKSDAFAVALAELGVKKGDRVAIILPNCAQFVIAFYGIMKAGAIVCALNPTYPPDKLKELLQDCGANTVVVLTKFYDGIKQIQADTPVKNVIATNIKEYLPPIAGFLFTIAKEKKEGHAIEKHAADHWMGDLVGKYAGRKPNVTVTPEDEAIFQYTGGTTGISKAAVATHQALVNNALMMRAAFGNYLDPSGEVLLAAIPLFHVFGMVAVLTLGISTGSKLLMVANPREIDEMLEVITAYKPTVFMGVPALYNAINNNKGVLEGKYNIKSIKACCSGSAPLAPATKQRFEQLSGGKLCEGFGMSECPTAVAVNPLDGVPRDGSIGLPLPDVEMRIINIDDGKTEMPQGEAGELAIWSPNLMKGYHNKPKETETALRVMDDGRKWLFTGDIAYMDEDGYFYIVDRKKDMALIGGFNVYPANVEKIFMEHPAVQDVGVAAIPHPDPSKEGQEAVKAWIILKPGQTATAEDLIKFAGTKLAPYEVPYRIEFISELPKTLVGKVLRRELVKMEMESRAKKN